MLADQQFKMRMYPDAKQMLAFIASRERRTKANVVDVLIREKYEALKGEQRQAEPAPEQKKAHAVTA